MTNWLPTQNAEYVIKNGDIHMLNLLVSSYSLSGPLIKMALKRKDLTKYIRIMLQKDLEALKKQNKEIK